MFGKQVCVCVDVCDDVSVHTTEHRSVGYY